VSADDTAQGALKTRPKGKRSFLQRLFPKGLSGKLLLLTIAVVMVTEILVFVPSVANYRLTWLARHFNTGEAASLALERLEPDDVPEDIREQLLSLTQTDTIVVRSEGASRVLATKKMPGEVKRHVELIMPGRTEALRSIADAFDTLINGGDRLIRVFGPMEQRGGTLELVMNETPLRNAMLRYAGNVMLISLAISLITALAVFLTLRWLLIRPMQRLTGSMLTFAKNPDDQMQVMTPSGRQDEIGVAEEQLSSMQEQLRGTLAQRRNLASLGLAVSKINHDLRNILASASLFTDRLTTLSDPTVQRLAPRLIKTIDRAVDYTRSVLAYGKAGEDVPIRSVVRLHRLLEDVAELLALDLESGVHWDNQVTPDFEVEADIDQLFRAIMNLCRNSVQIMSAEESDGLLVKRLTVTAQKQDGKTRISISDTGPGFPAEMRDGLFSAFQKSGRKGGTGLGLAIAAEIVRAHKGTIRLLETDAPGAHFEIELPSSARISKQQVTPKRVA